MGKLLTVEIYNIRGIKSLSINMPLNPDVYAITGVNGIGKSTLLMSISPRLKRPINFSNFKANDFGEDSYIKYKVGKDEETWIYRNNMWCCDDDTSLDLRGFQEGSITKGTRFTNVSTYFNLKKLQRVNISSLVVADDFVKESLGLILHNDKTRYKELYRLDRARAEKDYKYKGVPYFFSINGNLISQFELSTGELLLINLLHLLNNLLVRTNNCEKLNLILIDEIELALHPSAIKRLVKFMKDIAHRYNISVYFSTHSLEIIRDLPIDNLFYLKQVSKNQIICETPCYPAYITRDIYTHSGYDLVILVEDDLAQNLVIRHIEKENLDKNKSIQVLPVGGYDNTLSLHENFLIERTLANVTHILSIIDGDAKTIVEKKQLEENMWNNIPKDSVLYLPIESLEKYLKIELFDKKNYALARRIRDRFFKFESEVNWFENEYLENIKNKKEDDIKHNKGPKTDISYFSNGKNLFSILSNKYLINGGKKDEFRKNMCHFIIEINDFSEFENKLREALNKVFNK